MVVNNVAKWYQNKWWGLGNGINNNNFTIVKPHIPEDKGYRSLQILATSNDQVILGGSFIIEQQNRIYNIGMWDDKSNIWYSLGNQPITNYHMVPFDISIQSQSLYLGAQGYDALLFDFLGIQGLYKK